MASPITSSSPATVSNTLSANQMVSSFFSSISKSFAMIGIWLRFAFLSPRSILLYIGVSISKAAHKCRCNNPCSSRSSFIFFPNYCCPLNIIILSELPISQRIQSKQLFPSPHTRMCEGYFSASIVLGGLSIMAANASSQSFSGCSRNPCTSI